MNKYRELRCPLHGELLEVVSSVTDHSAEVVSSVTGHSADVFNMDALCPRGCIIRIKTQYSVMEELPSADEILKNGVFNELTGKVILPDDVAGLTIDNKQVSGIQYSDGGILCYINKFHSVRVDKEKK
jgi:hypothetical protein